MDLGGARLEAPVPLSLVPLVGWVDVVVVALFGVDVAAFSPPFSR